MVQKVYFDTSVWLAPYDSPCSRLNQDEVVASITRICDHHKRGALQLVTSTKVLEEMSKQLSNPEKRDKASRALKRIDELQIDRLPRAPADLGKLVLDEARFDVAPKFRDIPKHDPDKDIIEYATENKLDFFVSLDEKHILNESTKRELESRLRSEGTKVVTPQELAGILFQTK
jgi:predicted nucleic acid-binding protein